MPGAPGFLVYRFAVEMDSINVAEFSEVSGLQSDIETLSWEEGGNNEYIHLLPVRARWNNLTLKRGVADQSLWQWYFDCARGTIKRRGLSITLYQLSADGPRAHSLRWNVKNALPVKWIGPNFKADGSEIAFESIELAHHGFEQVKQ